MADIEWMDPPRSEVDEWDEIAEAVKSRPGMWARVKTGVGRVNLAETIDPLMDRDLEIRFIGTHGRRGSYGERGDVYAKLPIGSGGHADRW